MNTSTMLEWYKEEKAIVIGDVNERTGLEDFPSFQEWKAEFQREYDENHVSVSSEEADAMFEQSVVEADAELIPSPNGDIVKPTRKEVIKMNTTQTSTSTGAVKPAAVKPAKPATPAASAAPVAAAPSKSQIAQAIFVEEYPKGTARKDIIKRFINEANLTDSGAATYFQNLTKKLDKLGLTKRAPAAPAAPVAAAATDSTASA